MVSFGDLYNGAIAVNPIACDDHIQESRMIQKAPSWLPLGSGRPGGPTSSQLRLPDTPHV